MHLPNRTNYELWVITLGKICTYGKCPKKTGDEASIAKTLFRLSTNPPQNSESAMADVGTEP